MLPLFAHFHCVNTVLSWPYRDKKIPHLTWRRSWWHSIKNEEESGLFPSPTFPLIVNCSPPTSLGVVPYHPPACKPQNHPIIINHFLSITLPLVEFFLNRNKGPELLRAPRTPPSSFKPTILQLAKKKKVGCLGSQFGIVGTKEPFDENGRREWKSWLKTQLRKLRSWHPSPITSWQIDGETVETVTDFIFLGSKITADGDCNHEIKRRLLLGRKVMTNLKVKVSQLCLTLFYPVDYTVHGIPPALSLIQGIFLTQGSNPGLPHCRWILYQLSHKGNPWPN